MFRDAPLVLCVGTSNDQLAAVAAANKGALPVLYLPDVAALVAMLQGEQAAHRVVEVGKLRLDADLRDATWQGGRVELSSREFDLLFTLAGDAGRVWTFAELTANVWGRPYVGDTQAVVSAVKRLRRTLRAQAPEVSVESIRGVGYRVRVPTELPTPSH